MDKDAAERLAKRTPGVRSVQNMIDVDSGKLDDKRIAEDIRGRLARSAFIRAPDVNIDVSAGVVNLAGAVGSWEEGEQIERVAREVRGVRQIINRLELRHESSSMDDDIISASIAGVLERDAYLAGYDIEVSVESAVVRLTGEVPYLFHKERAGNEARSVRGVRQIENELVVVSQAILDTIPNPSDADLQRSVSDELQADPRVPTENVRVTVSRGEVTLVGLVDSIFAKHTAERVARRVLGVNRVRNGLDVQPIARGDSEIAADVNSNLASDSMLHDQKISAVVHDAMATLSGEVSSNSVKYHALRVVARVSGVREIKSDLRLRDNNVLSDEEIQSHVIERLASNAMTRANANTIKVQVVQGNVVLSGTVDRWIVAMDAERIVRTSAGVRRVKNEIQRR